MRSILILTSLAPIAACSSIKQPDTQNGGACSLTPGATIDESVSSDAEVRAFLQASVDFTTSVDDLKAKVYTACGNIAKDLGAQDTWTGLKGDAQISNDQHTGACDAAAQKIEQLVTSAPASVLVALDVRRGSCHIDFDEQTKCDTECAVNKQCTPGSVETRCEPGQLSVNCSAECTANSWCEGKSQHPAKCHGKCEASCKGQCKGTSVEQDGKVMNDNPSCTGKCFGTCMGDCEGKCKLDTNVNCGADVKCTGSCMSTYSDPVCTTKCIPPTCQEMTQCHEACTARVTSKAVCDPTEIHILVDLTAAPQLKPLLDTLEKNLPPVIDAAQTKGVLLVDAADRLATNGNAITNKKLDTQSLACAGLATAQLAKAVSTIKLVSSVCVNVNAKVETRIVQ